MNKLTIPEAAAEDRDSVEMLSAWIANRALHCSIKVGMYRAMGLNEETAWGRVLADTARHIANALQAMEGADAQAALARIQVAFVEELGDPTSPATGKFVRKN